MHCGISNDPVLIHPLSIVEAWTFNFQYHQVPGTNTIVPVFSIDRAMSGMSLAGDNDPIMAASMQGKNITLGEVKRSVKVSYGPVHLQ
jgi:meiosis-specific protein